MPVDIDANLVELGHPISHNVGVFGAGGKSTLASAIARKHDLEFIELDWIQHMPGWERRPVDEVEKIVAKRMQSNPRGWVTDHNFNFVLQHAKSVIVLNLPYRTIFWRRFKRSLHRAWTKEIVCGGNTETFRQHFTTRESAILEAWQRRKRYSGIFESVSPQVPPGIDLYHIRTPRELNQFYEIHGLPKDALQSVVR